MCTKALITAATTALLAFSAQAKDKKNDPTHSSSAKEFGQCHGINSCKGQGICGTATHGCAGLNSCKGKGWVKKNKDECEKKGGQFKSHKGPFHES